MRERILLVDDEKPFCLTLKRALERRGYEVETAFDGRSAIALAEQTPFDLMVVDVRMPDINGLEALQAVKDVQPRIEGIVITGYASYEAPVNAIKLGVRDYLGKPFDLDTFLQSIERVLTQAREAAQRVRRSSRVRHVYLDSLELLARSFGAPSPSRRAPAAGSALGLGVAQAVGIDQLASLSHLGRTRPLSQMGADEARRHCLLLQQVLEPIEELRSLLPTLLCLYERVDGGGFPDGLRGEEISMPARLMTAVAVWDEEGPDKARSLCGTWLDERVVEALAAVPDGAQGGLEVPSTVLEERYNSLMRLATACRQAGDPATARQALALATAAAERLGDNQKEASCLLGQSWLALESGAPEDCRATLERALEAARLAGPTVLAHSRVEQGRIRHAMGDLEGAETALLEALRQFERWQWRYQAARTGLLLAVVYQQWKPDRSRAHLGAVLREPGLEDLYVWEWAMVGPLLAEALGAPTDADAQARILAIFDHIGPAALALWPENAAPSAVLALPSMRQDAPELPPTAGMHIQCLGEFTVMVGTTPIKDSGWRGRKVKNLFSYLVLQQGRLVSQDVLLELFWPDSPEDRGRHALHQSIFRLRKALDSASPGSSAYVLQQADTYGFNRDLSYSLDVEVFEKRFVEARGAMAQRDAAATQRALVEAERVYGGELLLNAPYEDWCSDLRESYRRKFQDVLQWLAASYQEGGRMDAAIDYARRLWQLDPSREESARLLMRALWLEGRRDDALRVYQQCAQLLQEEVGVTPLPETRSLYDKIAKGEVLIG